MRDTPAIGLFAEEDRDFGEIYLNGIRTVYDDKVYDTELGKVCTYIKQDLDFTQTITLADNFGYTYTYEFDKYVANPVKPTLYKVEMIKGSQFLASKDPLTGLLKYSQILTDKLWKDARINEVWKDYKNNYYIVVAVENGVPMAYSTKVKTVVRLPHTVKLVAESAKEVKVII